MATITRNQAVAIVARAFASLGNGLREAEIAAATGLTEDQVYRALKGRIDFQDRGDAGIFYTSTRPLADVMGSVA